MHQLLLGQARRRHLSFNPRIGPADAFFEIELGPPPVLQKLKLGKQKAEIE